MSDHQDKLQIIRQLSLEGRHDAAEREARKLLELLPAAGEATFLLAHAVHQQDRPEEALTLYDLALRYAPKHASALNNSASLLRQMGRHDEALRRYRLATDADPEKPWIWSNFARALAERDRPHAAIEALKRAAALDPENDEIAGRLVSLTAEIEGDSGESEDRGAATKTMWELNPAVADFDRMGFALRPYVERTGAPNYRSATLNTDRHGFRCLKSKGEEIGYDAFAALPGPKGIVCGASQALGYGIPDEATIQAHLTARRAGGATWYSLAAPISQIFQQRLLFELFAPAETRYCVVISGTVNVLFSLLAEADRSPYPPVHNVSYEWPADPEGRDGALGIDAAFERTAEWMCDNIAMFAAKCRQLDDCRLLFCHPPVLAWTGKPVHESEERLCSLYRVRHPDYAELVEDPANRGRWQQYCQRLKAAVEAVGGTYLETSEHAGFHTGDALFCDALHPNETGSALLSDCISHWAESAAHPILSEG